MSNYVQLITKMNYAKKSFQPKVFPQETKDHIYLYSDVFLNQTDQNQYSMEKLENLFPSYKITEAIQKYFKISFNNLVFILSSSLFLSLQTSPYIINSIQKGTY